MNTFKNAYPSKCNHGNVYKEYIGILEGVLKNKNGIIDAPISRKDGSIIERCIDKNGTKAITHYSVIRTKNNLSLVKFILETGRTHQIRLHSKYIGHPILGDTLYGTSSDLINRQALHCYKMCFNHPILNKRIELECDIPKDMKLF